MAMDAAVLIVTGYAAYSMSLEYRLEELVLGWQNFIWTQLILLVVNNYFMGKFGFYSERRFSSAWEILRKVFLANTGSFMLLSVGVILIGILPFPRTYFLIHFVMAFVVLSLIRIGIYRYMERRTIRAFNSRRILLLGPEERIYPVAEALRVSMSWGHQIVGWINVDHPSAMEIKEIPYLGTINDFDCILKKNEIDEVVFVLPRECPIDFEHYLEKCDEMGVAYRIVPGLYNVGKRTFRVETIQDIPTLAAYNGSTSASALLYKKILDFTGGFIGFIFFLIVCPFVSMAIKLESPGPIFFKQKRVGLNGRHFNIYKFRSMVMDAENIKSELLANNEMNGPIFKMVNDPRITRVGRFLRKTSLDEFPQFINVLKGEMGLVGTRPPTPDEVEGYKDWHRKRISLKPGLTGMWQVSGRNKINDFDEVVKLDLKYIDHWRFLRDIAILWKTVWVVLARKGAR
jgi:exopolysaccharide biosynthesis polyprenyl glycosylphosphotransferase